MIDKIKNNKFYIFTTGEVVDSCSEESKSGEKLSLKFLQKSITAKKRVLWISGYEKFNFFNSSGA